MVSLIAVFVVVFCTCGCLRNSDYNLRRQERVFANQLFDYLQDEDVDSLEDLFSGQVSADNDIETELEVFFASIDGDIESYDHIQITVSEKNVDNHQVTLAMMHVVFYDVVTDSGTEYDYVVYERFVIADDNSEDIGLFSIRIVNSDDDFDVSAGGYAG